MSNLIVSFINNFLFPVKMAVKAKKKWLRVLALKPFNDHFIGETFVFNAEDAIGKKIKISLMSLTNDPKRQNINLMFEITKKHGDCLGAEIVGYNLVASSIKRFVRRNCNRIDDSYSFRTKDNKKIRIKPILLTRSLAKGSVLKAIRKSAKEFLSDAVSKSDYYPFFNDVIYHRLQKNLRDNIKKVYPLRVCEIRTIKLEKEKKRNLNDEGVAKQRKSIEKAEKEEPKTEVKDKGIKEDKKAKEPDKEEMKEITRAEEPMKEKEVAPSKSETEKADNK